MASHDPTSRPRPSRHYNVCFQCVAGLPQFSFDQFPPATMALLCSQTQQACANLGAFAFALPCALDAPPQDLCTVPPSSPSGVCANVTFSERPFPYPLSLILLPSAASCVSVFTDLTPFRASAFLDFWGLPGTMEALGQRVRGRGQALQAGMVPLLPAC